MSDTPKLSGWQVLRDPARPTWPGVLVVSNEPSSGFISVTAGSPKNFADSKVLGDRIAFLLTFDEDFPSVSR